MLLLSEAMRLGAMMKPQGKGIESADPRAEATCALGAAAMAAGLPIEKRMARTLNVRGQGGFQEAEGFSIPSEWLRLMMSEVSCPSCAVVYELAGAIAHLNDDHDWSRERIADWVESIERERGLIPQVELVSTG